MARIAAKGALMQNQGYIPGVCNINVSEIQKRRKTGFVGLAMLLVTLAGLFVLQLPAAVWLVTFIPSFLMATGFLQAKHKFCVGYAAAGMHHTGSTTETTTDQKAVALDKQRAKSINLQAMAIGLGIAVASALVALLIV